MLKSKNNTLEINLYKDFEKEKLKIYYFDYKTYNKTIDNLKLEQLDYNIDKNKLKGEINSTGGTLMITIPYEKGYVISVDGKHTDYKKVLDTFIGIDLKEGTHKILIEYKQPGLIIGTTISIIDLIAIIIYLKREKEYEKKD